jgi:hypothetical protein
MTNTEIAPTSERVINEVLRVVRDAIESYAYPMLPRGQVKLFDAIQQRIGRVFTYMPKQRTTINVLIAVGQVCEMMNVEFLPEGTDDLAVHLDNLLGR